jgi:hypothetical protein
MKLKKFRKFLVLSVMLCLLLTGCVNTQVRVVVDEYAGGSMTLRVLVEETVYQMMRADGAQMSVLGGFELEAPIKGEDGKTYIPFVKTDAFVTYDDMVKGLLDVDGFASYDEDMEEPASGEDTSEATATEANNSESSIGERTGEDETQSEASKKLFSEVEITKQESLNGYIYTFRAVVQKQGDEAPTPADGVTQEILPNTEGEQATDLPVTADTADDNATSANDSTVTNDGTTMSGEFSAEIDLSPIINPFAASINDMFKVQLEIVLPAEIQDYRGGIAQGNTLVCDIKDLSVDTEIYASGELVLVDLEPVPEEYTDIPTQGIDPQPEVSGFMLMSIFIGLSAMITGIVAGITLGVLKLLKRR